MRVKHKETGSVAIVVRANPSTVSPMEMIVLFEDGSMDSDYVKDYDPVDEGKTHQDLLNYLDAEERSRIG